jgi:hypothetical protein
VALYDFRCPVCGRVWEQQSQWTKNGVLRPRCVCGRGLGEVVWLKAPGIRTEDNAPRDMRKFTTAGHVVEGQTVHGRRVWDSQLGKETEHMTTREIERHAREQGLEIVPQGEYGRKHLSYEPPPPRLEDDPALLRETQELAADTWDQSEAGALPPLERPLLEQDAEGRDAAAEIASEAAPIAVQSAAAVEGA